MMYALYDKDDRPLGTYNTNELRKLLNTTNASFRCIMCRLRKGKNIRYKGIYYTVYMYKDIKQ